MLNIASPMRNCVHGRDGLRVRLQISGNGPVRGAFGRTIEGCMEDGSGVTYDYEM